MTVLFYLQFLNIAEDEIKKSVESFINLNDPGIVKQMKDRYDTQKWGSKHKAAGAYSGVYSRGHPEYTRTISDSTGKMIRKQLRAELIIRVPP